MKRDDFMEINDYFYTLSAKRQVYTSKEIGISGIRLFGHLVNSNAQKPLMMHTHPDCMEICYIVKGNQTYKTEDLEYELTGDDVFITFPNELHGTGTNPDGKFEIYWIQLEMNHSNNFLSLKKPLSTELQNALLHIKNRKCKCNICLSPLLEDALINITCDNKIKKLSGLSSLMIFLSKIIELNEANINYISPTIQAAKNYIIQNILAKITLDDLAKHTGFSLSHFKKRFKKETGETPNDYINYLKIGKAKELLKLNECTITEAAYALDFSSSS